MAKHEGMKQVLEEIYTCPVTNTSVKKCPICGHVMYEHREKCSKCNYIFNKKQNND